MDHIGASSRLVNLALKPLGRFKAPYVVMMLSYFVNVFMSLPVPSASGLAMLMMVTLFPILTSLGVSRPAAASAIATGHLLDWGPASATSLLISRYAEMPVTEYFVNYQMPVYACCAVAASVTHFFWQQYLDRKQGLYLDPHSEEFEVKVSQKQMEGNAPPGPVYYIFLPLMPIIFLVGFSQYGYQGIKMNVNVAMYMSLAIAMLCEFIRHKGNLRTVCDSIHVFFKGMGDQFTMTVTLITAGQTFAYGLQCLGVVGSVIAASQTLGVSATMLGFLASIILFVLGMIMGSGVAPLFSFIPLIPDLARSLGAKPVALMLPMQNGTCLGRLLSPITAVIVAVSSIAAISPFELVKRNSVPVLVSFVTSTLAIWFFFG